MELAPTSEAGEWCWGLLDVSLCMWAREVAAAGWGGGGLDSELNRGAWWVSGREVCVLCFPTRPRSTGRKCLCALFPVGESTHKHMQNYAQIDPEGINGIGTSVTTQLTCTVHSPHLS